MANYAILRMQKHKSSHSIRGALKHMHRDYPTPNADTGQREQNDVDYTTSTNEAMKLYRDRLKETGKVRKNAVHAVEFFVSGSPESMKALGQNTSTDYLNDAKKYIEGLFGKENIIASAIHRDETTDHLSVIALPITKDQKLSYKQFLGGSKHQLVKLQTHFHEKVAQKYGLDRGIEGSKAKHQDIKKYYSMINKAHELNQSEQLDKKLGESKAKYRERILDPLLAAAHKGKDLEKTLETREGQMRGLEGQNRQLEYEKNDAQIRLNNWREMFPLKGFSEERFNECIDLVAEKIEEFKKEDQQKAAKKEQEKKVARKESPRRSRGPSRGIGIE